MTTYTLRQIKDGTGFDKDAKFKFELVTDYNGWTNRETWAVKLWLDNDQGLYEMAREWAASGRAAAQESEYWTDDDSGRRLEASYAADRIHEGWDELTTYSEDGYIANPVDIIAMVKDVGSDYRVNWDEIGAAYISDLDES